MDTTLPDSGARLPMRRCARITLIALAAAAALVACGGNGADDDTPTDPQAEGHAADAATMPLAAGTALGAATVTLQSALVSAGTVAGSVAAAKEGGTHGAASPLATGPVTSLPCARGGRVSWVAGGPPLALLINGRLDAGETFEVTYTSCRTAWTGVELDGAAGGDDRHAADVPRAGRLMG